MSMLSSQADELRKCAERLRQLANGAVNQGFPARQDLFESAAEMREAADTIEGLRDRLQESYGQVPEQGEREGEGERESYSRWHQLFSTPEQAARTLADNCDDYNLCDGCPADCASHDCYDALLEWLR